MQVWRILHTYLPMKMEQSVPKRRHIKFRRRGITQKQAHNIQNTAKVWNQETVWFLLTMLNLRKLCFVKFLCTERPTTAGSEPYTVAKQRNRKHKPICVLYIYIYTHIVIETMKWEESWTYFYCEDANVILASSRDFYFLQNVTISYGIDTTSCIMCTGRLSPG